MFTKCSDSEIIKGINGLIGIRCDALNYEGIPVEHSATTPLEVTNDMFVLLGVEGVSTNNVAEQTAQSADGTATYKITAAKEGYILDFPPYPSMVQKTSIIADYFTKGLFLIQRDIDGYYVYGILNEAGTHIVPFSIKNISKVAPNGRFSSGTTLATQQVSFVIDNDYVDYNIAKVKVSGIEDSVVARLVKGSAAKSVAFAIVNAENEAPQKVTIPTGTTVTVNDFVYAGGTPTQVAVTNGEIVFTATGSNINVTQVNSIAGVWTIGTVTLS